MPPEYYCWEGNDLTFNVFFQPQASRNALLGLHDNAVKIALRSPPVEGAANKQLILFLSTLLNVKKANIAIISGEKNRRKRVRVRQPLQLPEGLFIKQLV